MTMTPAQRRYREMFRRRRHWMTTMCLPQPSGDFTACGETPQEAAENLALLVAVHCPGLDVAQDVRERIAAAGVQMWDQ